tara:strand:- start:80 stop:307 length:228 start_codon:yes stop_codon:yes gene_type:complete
MIIFKNELPIDHEKSIQHIVHTWANEVYQEDDIHIDHATELAWDSVVEHLQCENLHIQICGDATKMAFANCDYVK